MSSKGCTKTLGCNIGGIVKLNGLELVFTQAFHSMSSNPSGVIIFYNNKTIYHAGDTGVFGDMKLIGEMYPIDLAFLPVAHAIAYSTQWHTALFPYTIFKHYKCTAHYALGDHL